MLPTPDTHQLPEVYDRSNNPSHENVDGLLFVAGRRSQSAEMTEMQQYLHKRIDALGSAVFADGDVIEGGSPVIIDDVENKNIRVHAGKVFLKGKVHHFENAELLIPTNEQVSLGIRLYTEIVDHADDISLLNPAVRRRGYGEPGAYRVKSWVEWGFRAESGDSDGGSGEFFPVYLVDNGVIIEQNASPMTELVYKAISRYDYDGNGSYVSGGLRVEYITETATDYSFKLEAGAAHILGNIVERKADDRLTFTKDPDELTSTNEFHIFTPDSNGKMNVVVSRPPISTVTQIIGQKQKTVTVIRGQVPNTTDIIDETVSSVVSIISVVRGGTTYVEGTDYTLSGDEISWAPGGVEPAAGETYNVTFRYMDSDGVPESIEAEYFVVSGYVAGQSLLVTYNYKLPRVDLIVLKGDGTVGRIKGVPALRNPGTPVAGPNEIGLATVEYDWFNPPVIRNVSVRAVHMSDLEDMRANIFELFRLHAQEKLRNDANQKDPSTKIGVFVDSFKDDSQRDNGQAQTAAIVDGFLMLPMEAEPLDPDGLAQESHQTLNYTPVIEIQQVRATQCGLINPYQTVGVPDGKLSLSPHSDTWTMFVSQFTSQLTKLIVRSGLVNRLGAIDARRERRQQQLLENSDGNGTEIVTQDDINAELTESSKRGIAIRQRTIKATISGFQPEETITEALFDGVIIPGLVGLKADIDGNLTGNFIIPANIPVGKKLVYVLGEFGTYAETTYTAAFNVIPNPPPPRKKDPLAQSFTPKRDFQIVGADVKFCKKGPTLDPVTVQLREMVNGYPGPKVLAEQSVTVDQMNILDGDTATGTLLQRCYVRSDQPAQNFDTGNSVLIGYSHNAWMYRGLLQFSLPANLANATIFSARLSMRKLDGDKFSIKAHRLTQPFNAAAATWNNRDAGTAWTSPGGTFAAESSDGTVTLPARKKKLFGLDITNIVKQWANGQANHGIVLRSAEEGVGGASAKSATLDWTGYPPVLEIVYKPAGAGILGEGWTRVLFPLPTFVRKDTDYCLTLLTTDPGHSVSFARLGDVMQAKDNNGASGLVTQQPYPEGVLFDSSNNTTWTPRQKDDLTFRILRAQYDTTERIVDLGNVSSDESTDFMVRGMITRYTGDTNITFDVTPPGGLPLVNLENCQTLPLTSRVTGTYNIKARIKGTSLLSPILYANTVAIAGNVANNGTYISRRIKAKDTFTATVIFRAYLPAGASVQVAVSNATYSGANRVVVDGEHQYTWANLTLDSSEAIDGGYVEQIWKLTGVRGVTLENLSQIKITLNGSPTARLLVKDLQFYTK